MHERPADEFFKTQEQNHRVGLFCSDHFTVLAKVERNLDTSKLRLYCVALVNTIGKDGELDTLFREPAMEVVINRDAVMHHAIRDQQNLLERRAFNDLLVRDLECL